MCNVCNNVKTERNINAIVGLLDMIEKGEFPAECKANLNLYLGSIEVEEDDHLAVARSLGEPEPELYTDDSPYTTNMVDEDILAQVVELQERMDTGMCMIKEVNARIEKGLAHLTEWKTHSSYTTWPYHKLMTELHTTRSKYWDHWWNLKRQCDELIGNDKSVWAAYFRISNLEEWLMRHLEGEHQARGDEHLLSDPEIDSRMLVTHEAYAIAHEEEEKELFSYNK